MNKFMIIALSFLATIVFIFALLTLIGEMSERNVYGKFIPDEEAVPYLTKYLDKYELNDQAWPRSKILSGFQIGKPYIAELRKSPFGAWSIEGYGRIRRGTMADHMITSYFNKITKPLPSKLSDL